MLGSAFLKLLEADARCELFAFDSGELDVMDYERVGEVLGEMMPDFVINCTGYTNVDLAESEKDKAFALNADVVGNLGRLSRELNFKLIHFSTDYVFPGEKGTGYLESDLAGPLNVYGESKYAGEKALLECGANAYIVRTAWLFGPNGKNFVDTMIRLGRENGSVQVVNDQFGSPTYTLDLAAAVLRDFVFMERDFGIYHLVNSGGVSWYEFALNIFVMAGMKVEVEAVSSNEFVRPAKRPNCGILLNSKLPLLRPYEEALSEYIGLLLG